MEIVFTRHAQRRAKLYGLAEAKIRDILAGKHLRRGEHTIVKDVAGLSYPIKIVIMVENEVVKVITNYPLKKGRKK